ncbi:unnamed protein product [Cuscuta campestris]|uniref:cytokinin riboside 5'-monophosphate phosphoribohydrolase n=1 Tax=Cuscuta campestris TaxID=132261 RepID=A0A484LYH8_9ASTE|nr:unnamed protein product [Cuscuta campestris]
MLELNDCLYVPAISRNIISVSCLDKSGFIISIKDKSLSVYRKNVFYANANMTNGLYVLDLDMPVYNISAKRNKPNGLNQTYLWHCRLGHINEKRISKLQQSGILESFDLESYDTCESCLLGKMTKSPFTGHGERAGDLLALIHSDVCRPFNTTARGNDIPTLTTVKTWLSKSFSMKDLGDASYALGIRIYRDRSQKLLGLSQSTYIDKALARFGMSESKRGSLPMVQGTSLSKTQGASTPEEVERMRNVPYASAIGSIMYAMVIQKPNSGMLTVGLGGIPKRVPLVWFVDPKSKVYGYGGRFRKGLLRRKIKLAYGGGSVGLQGAVASTVFTNGGLVRGFIPGYIATRRVYGPTYGVEHKVSSNYYKYFEMNHAVEAFIFLRGGVDTMDGLFTLISWASEGLHNRPIGLLNIDGYFNNLLKFLDDAVRQNFMASSQRKLFIHSFFVDELLDKLEFAKAFPGPGAGYDCWSCALMANCSSLSYHV